MQLKRTKTRLSQEHRTALYQQLEVYAEECLKCFTSTIRVKSVKNSPGEDVVATLIDSKPLKSVKLIARKILRKIVTMNS